MTDEYKQIADRLVEIACSEYIDEKQWEWEYPDELQDAAQDAADAIYELLEDVPEEAEWEERTVEGSEPWFRRRFYCSACGDWQTYGKTRFCPNCGAQMKE